MIVSLSTTKLSGDEIILVAGKIIISNILIF